MRQKIIAGNWKMNNTRDDAQKLINELIPLVKNAKSKVIVCVPFISLNRVKKLIKGTNISLGAQNVSWANSGAFTGEISADMLLDVGAQYVIIGHSERRQYFAETDKTVNARALQALNKGLKPIICVGETLQQRESGKTQEVCKTQTEGAFLNITAEQLENCIIAYEPVWAIGTGKTATAAEANETIKYIRGVMASLYGKAAADKVIIQYGGSMNAANAAELLAQSDIDGGLIGGASLKASDFATICNV